MSATEPKAVIRKKESQMQENKLPIWRTVILAVRFSVEHPQPLVLYLAQYLIVTVPVALMIIPAIETVSPISSLMVAFVVNTFAWCPIAVAIHRRILSDESLRPASYVQSLGSARTFRFFGYSVLFMGIAALVWAIVWFAFGVDTLAGVSAIFVAMLVVTALLIRLALVFPGIALDESAPLKAAWQLLHGSTWRLFWAALIIGMPLSITDAIATRYMDGWSAHLFSAVIWAIAAWLFVAVVSYTYSFVNRGQ
jgi:hypothetical protein